MARTIVITSGKGGVGKTTTAAAMAMGLAHASLGHRGQAVRYADDAVRFYPISKDAWAGPIVARNRVLVLTRVGELDAALAQVETLLSFPNPGASPALFRVDPRLAELHRHPSFDEVLAGAAVPVPLER